MSNIIQMSAHENRRIRLNRDAVASVARYVHLRPAPDERAEEFVARIVREYKKEAGE